MPQTSRKEETGMTRQQQISVSIFDICLRAKPAALVAWVILAAILMIVPAANAQTFTVLHNFTGGQDGKYPYTGLTMDRAGNLYGTRSYGGYVYELSPSGSGWTYNTLYTFTESFGGGPAANLALDSSGNLYGTTRGGGGTNNPWGNVFKLTPSNGGWIYTDLHDFTGGSDGGVPYSSVVVDSNGNLYGTATVGGANDDGVVWEITP